MFRNAIVAIRLQMDVLWMKEGCFLQTWKGSSLFLTEEVFSFIGNHIPVLVGSFSSPLSTSLKNPISKTCESTHLVTSSTAVC